MYQWTFKFVFEVKVTRRNDHSKCECLENLDTFRIKNKEIKNMGPYRNSFPFQALYFKDAVSSKTV